MNIFCSGCGDKKEDEIKDRTGIDTIEIIDPEPELEINYYYYPIEGLKTLTDLKEEFGEEGKYLILALNRLDNRNLRKWDSLIVPDTILSSIMYYSPFPEKFDAADSIPKLLLFSHKFRLLLLMKMES